MLYDRFINTPGGKVWTGVQDNGDSIPIIVVHGGPGFPHNYLEPLLQIKSRKVIMYDQLDCGLSEKTGDTNLWTVDRYVEEIRSVVQEIVKESDYIIYGHSWGSLLANEYASKYPQGIKKLIFAGPCLSTDIWIKDTKKLVSLLPTEMQEVLRLSESTGSTDSLEYSEAYAEYIKRYVCRIFPPPECYLESRRGSGDEVYVYLWGESEIVPNGQLKNYNGTPLLKEIKIPILFTCGEYDESTPETNYYYASLCENAKVKVFKGASHMPHLESQEDYLESLNSFLK